jgi:DNA-binding MarR family transcriptional regulator
MQEYVQSIMLADRVYRLFLENVKYELHNLNIRDLTHTQALILYNIGYDTVAINELTYRKYYLGSNVTYNLKKMIEAGYIKHDRSTFDKRSLYVSLSERGLKLYSDLEQAFQKYLQSSKNLGFENFSTFVKDMELNLMSSKK